MPPDTKPATTSARKPATKPTSKPTPVSSGAATRARGARPRTRRNDAGHETRERLLDAAEALFADRGLDVVSVRDITEASDANTAAIHYHFGSKRDLIAAILERRAGLLGQRREELLDELDARDQVDLRAVVEAMVLPTAELASGSDGGSNYVAFLAAVGSHPELMPMVIKAYDPYTERYLQTLARYTPDLPHDVLVLRFGVAKDLVNRLLGRPMGLHGWLEQQSPGADDAMVDSLTDLVVGMLQGPVTKRRRRAKKAPR